MPRERVAVVGSKDRPENQMQHQCHDRREDPEVESEETGAGHRHQNHHHHQLAGGREEHPMSNLAVPRKMLVQEGESRAVEHDADEEVDRPA